VTMPHRSTFEQRLHAILTDQGGRIPVVVGLCGSGRTTLLRAVGETLGTDRAQYINVERTATTPERLLTAILEQTLFVDGRPPAPPVGPRPAFDAILAFFANARRLDGGRATFLLDEVLEFRTFESFPGLRHAVTELLTAIAQSPNRFVVSSRYVTRMERTLVGASPQFIGAQVPSLSVDEVRQLLAERGADADGRLPGGSLVDVAAVVQQLSEGRVAYALPIVEAITAPGAHGPLDPIAALAALFEPGHRLALVCGWGYELRLHRARGYGALKAILDILSQEEPLTLTEISHRLGRTPGSTKDYLSWLEDVDLVAVHQKRYRVRDPLMRLWIRLHCRPTLPTTEQIGREVQEYAAGRLPEIA
jgi:hypothetical protein